MCARRWAVALAGSLAAVVAVAVATPGRAAIPGRNGRLAYGVWGSPAEVQRQIYTVSRMGTGSVGLSPIPASWPVWSPDGRTIAYTDQTIWMMRADGGSAREAVHVPRDAEVLGPPAWSPDGRRLAYVEATYAPDPRDRENEIEFDTIRVTRLDGSQARRLRRGYMPTWSPDGRTIAYVPARSDAIALMRPDGGGQRVVARFRQEQPYIPGSMDISPDGRKLLFPTLRIHALRLNVLNLASGRVKRLPTVPGQPRAAVWAPDGTRVAYLIDPPRPGLGQTVPASEIWTMRPDGSGQRRLFQMPDHEWAESISWQPLR
jgi:Tol biopolymer transport system component